MMITRFPDLGRHLGSVVLGALAVLSLAAAPVAAQDLETFDPDAAYTQQQGAGAGEGAIDADLAPPQTTSPADPVPAEPTVDTAFRDYAPPPADGTTAVTSTDGTAPAAPAEGDIAPVTTAAQAAGDTYGEDDLIGAAEGLFGKGAEGLASLIEDLLRKQGEPNGYIVGREAGGAFIVGARYGSGTLHHKVEGTRKVYWTGPSIGFDAGANAANTFVLVYNLYDTEDLFARFPAGEGQAYFVGGLHASYMRRGDVVLIPIRVGAGLRLGINAGYMKFTKEQKWVPF